ncbi:DUF1987 domain-containing protein [Terasakiella sp. A23]|uniref:DUF1987 domain-containing protein n=1 Tax=Terasakiella sp. FCG-A23 TaxID=3080561 RepID=UPI00295541E3|nr:DUF1987 domain-containing protein [Terasakiella sp. A23]MDV7338915.1 DUF1987 domain-containing protein [Terasakiella sp. A23]
MEGFKIPGTDSTPLVDMNFLTGEIIISGESYSEEASDILQQAENKLKENISGIQAAEINVNLSFIYFNSSSARRIMHFLLLLDEIAEEKPVNIIWSVAEDDDGMEEIGEEYGEDMENANFKIVQT